jgi:hypothetical protein
LLDFKIKAKRFGIFAEWKDGVPRAAYRGIVTFKMYAGRATVGSCESNSFESCVESAWIQRSNLEPRTS